MNANEPHPTDVIAQKRAEAARPAPNPSPSVSYWTDRLNSPAGRAAIFAELMHANLFGEGPPAPASDRDLWLWMGNRMRAAQMLQDAIQIAPLAVGAMWSEAMKREFEKQAGINP